MSIQATSGDGVVFFEDFRSPVSVAANGGVVVGNCVAQGKYTGAGESAVKYVSYGKTRRTLTGNVWWVRFKFKANDFGAYRVLLSRGIAGNVGFYFAVGTSGNLYCYGYDGAAAFRINPNDNSAFVAGVTYEVSITCDGTKVYSYINGVLDGTPLSCTSKIALSTADLRIGSRESTIPDWNGDIYLVQMSVGVSLSAEEAKDLYEQDTIQELSHPLIDLPLRTSYYKENGVELLTDPNFDNATIDDWVASSAVISLSLSTASPYNGTQALRLTRATAYGYAKFTTLTSGKRLKVRGKARGDGTFYPRITDDSGNVLWAGTTSTAWQDFDFETISTGWLVLYTPLAGGGNGNWIEFDAMSIELMENLTDNKGTLGGTAKLGDGSTTTTMPTILAPHGAGFDGGDYIDMGRITQLEGASKATIAWMWKPTTLANSRGFGKDDGTGNERLIFFESTPSGGAAKVAISAATGGSSYAISGGYPIRQGVYYTGIMVFDGTQATANNRLKLYIDGKEITDFVYTGSFPATLTAATTNFLFGKRAGSTWMTGIGIRPRIFDKALTSRQAKILHNRLMKGLNV